MPQLNIELKHRQSGKSKLHTLKYSPLKGIRIASCRLHSRISDRGNLFIMEISEKELESFIFYKDNKILQDNGLYMNGRKRKQLKVGNYGVLDVLSYYVNYEYHIVDGKVKQIYPYLCIHIYELKKDEISTKTLLQCLRYCKGVKSYVSKRKPWLKFKVSLNLIGKSINTNNEFVYISDIFDDVCLYIYSVENNGDISFTHEYDYKLTNEGF